MRNRTIIATALAAATVAGAAYAQQNARIKPLTALDHVELQQLYVNYYWAADNGADDCMAYANLFTSDAEFFVAGNRTAAGRKELAAFCKTGIGDAPRHYGTNFRFEASPEGARGGAYFLILAPPEANKPQTILARGVYTDVLVKTREGWRFKERRFTSGLPSSANTAPARAN